MRLYAIVAGIVSLAVISAVPLTAFAQEIIIGTPPGYGVTVIQPYPAPPPPAIVIRPAPPPAAPYYDTPGVYAGYRSGGCGWLYHRAVDTGSPYWWSRYEACTE
jgi:hypothetical protein